MKAKKKVTIKVTFFFGEGHALHDPLMLSECVSDRYVDSFLNLSVDGFLSICSAEGSWSISVLVHFACYRLLNFVLNCDLISRQVVVSNYFASLVEEEDFHFNWDIVFNSCHNVYSLASVKAWEYIVDVTGFVAFVNLSFLISVFDRVLETVTCCSCACSCINSCYFNCFDSISCTSVDEVFEESRDELNHFWVSGCASVH